MASRARNWFLSCSFFLLNAACSTDPAEVDQDFNGGKADGLADYAPPPTGVHFREPDMGGGEEQLAPFFHGTSATLRIDRNRFPRCGLGERVSALLKSDGEDTWTAFTLAEISEGSTFARGLIVLPTTGTEVAIKLESWGSGCEETDDAGGEGYRFPIRAWRPAALAFPRVGAVQELGTIGEESTIIVDYATERLPQCRATYHEGQTWNIQAYARFETEEVEDVTDELSVVRYDPNDGNRKIKALAYFPVPSGASRVTVWFYNSDINNCQSWDPVWGAPAYQWDIVD
jgi:hypothetical protein